MAAKGLPLDAWFKFTGTQVGRDRLYRFAQYAALVQAARSTGETAQKWQKLSGALGQARKLFRIGKPLENLNGIIKAVQIADPITRYATLGSTTFMGLWLLQDMFQWLHAVGFIKVEDIKRLNTNTARAWFIGLLFSIALDIHKLQLNQAKQQKVQAVLKASGSASSAANLEAARRDLKALAAEQRTLLIDLVRDVLDLALPGSTLEYLKLSPTTVGVAGAVTSAIGIYQNWPKA